MIVSYLLLVLLAAFVSYATTAKIKITTCPEYNEERIRLEEPIPADLRIPTEEEIAVKGHFSGLKPLEYDISLFQTLTEDTYVADTSIVARVTKSTKHLMLNLHPSSPSCYFPSIVIELTKDNAQLRKICISKFTYVEKLQVFVVHLTQELPRKTRCTIKVFGCISTAYDHNSNIGANGLWYSKLDESEVYYSSFSARNARTVFPCMDHPSLKATFKLCIFHKFTFSVASCMDALPTHIDERQRGGMSTTCFETTPLIAPLSLSFALMKSYKKIVSDDANLSLLVPVSKINSFHWILEQAAYALSRMNNYTNLVLPLRFMKLQFLIVLPTQRQGGVSFGLIILDGNALTPGPIGLRFVLPIYRATVVQWLGNILTVRNLNELFMEDGLIFLLVWTLAGVDRSSYWYIENVQQLIIDGVQPSITSLIDESSILDGTYSDKHRYLGLLIFNNLHQAYGSEFATRFLGHLFSRYAFANAGIDEWDTALLESHQGFSSTLPVSYLKSWFSYPVPLKVVLLRGDAQHETDYIIQFCLESYHSNVLFPRSVFVYIYCSTWEQPKFVLIGENQQNFYEWPPTARWCLVDPDGVTLTYKIYDVTIYRNVLESQVSNSGILTEKRRQRFVKDFCTSLLNNFIINEDPSDKEAWLRVFELVKVQIASDSICSCCTTAPTERDAWCINVAEQCDRLQLIKFIFRNTDTVSDEVASPDC